MTTQSTVAVLLARLQSGDQDVVPELWERYFHRLQGLARKQLLHAYTGEADGEDIALSAIRTFCRRIEQGEYAELSGEGELWDLLATITRNKASKLRRRHSQAKRDWKKTIHDHGSEVDTESPLLAGLVSKELDPQERAEATDGFLHLLEVLQSDDLREVALLKLEGLKNSEIMDLQAVALSTVERRLALIRGIWQKELDADEAEERSD